MLFVFVKQRYLLTPCAFEIMSFKVRESHWHILVEYMSRYPDFARGRLNNAQARLQYKKMWSNLTEKLNSAGYGQKSVEKWQKTWSDYKQALKKKAIEIEKHRNQTGGGPEIKKTLSELELKILSVLGDTFYKGIGVPELGVAQENYDTGEFNIHPNKFIPSTAISSELVPLSDEPAFQSHIFSCSTPVKMQNTVPSLASKKSTFHHIPEPVSSRNFKYEPFSPMTITSEPKDPITVSADTPLPKEHSPCSSFTEEANRSIFNKSHKISFGKRSSDQVLQDHDYLTNLPFKKNKTVKHSEEDKINKMYSDTVDILHGINANITEGLQNVCDTMNCQNITLTTISGNVETLTKEIKSLTNVLKGFLENKSVDSNY